MKRPIRTTLIMSFFSGFAVYPLLIGVLAPVMGWEAASKLVLWVLAAVYAFFLAHWSGTPLQAIFFPLALLLGAAVWPYTYAGYFLMLPAVFSWIRSGICFRRHPLRAVAAELITVAGGIFIVGIWFPQRAVYWGLAIWLFGLLQCLYFYITGFGTGGGVEKEALDPFESARRGVERVLGQPWTD